jgi:signal transduction histidine kinase
VNESLSLSEQRVVRFFPYALLAVSLVLDLAVDGLDGVSIALVGGTALWLALTWRWGAALFLGQLAFSAALVAHTPLYGFFAWSCYLSLGRLPSRAAAGAGLVATAAVVAGSQIGGFPSSTSEWLVYIFVLVANAAVAGALTVRAIKQNEQRTRLEAALRENAGLHQQLLVQAREAGMLDERARMAREIHDTIAQGLIGIVTQIEAAEESASPKRHLDAATKLARESLAEARRSVQALRPQPLEEARLPEAQATVADGWSALNGVSASVSTTGDPRPLPVDVEATLLRTAQEALANVAKHASASRVGLTLSDMDEVVTLDVRDDGVGGAAARPGRSPPAACA